MVNLNFSKFEYQLSKILNFQNPKFPKSKNVSSIQIHHFTDKTQRFQILLVQYAKRFKQSSALKLGGHLSAIQQPKHKTLTEIL